jgi:scyllo-inositol 2-dehydrogenase (NADP+)
MSILIVGGGKMGLSHMAILNRLLNEGSVALCDSSPLSRYVFGKLGIRTYKSLDDALAAPTLWRGAVVATPTSSHFPIAQALLQRGIPCFIEKPLTLDPARSQTLADLQAQRGTVVQMGLVTRFIQPFVRLRSIVRSGVLGRPLQYRARMMGNVVTKPDNGSWRTNYQQGGGCLNEYGPHLIDLSRSIFGEVARLESASYGRVHSTQGDDRFDIMWRHADGTPGTLLLDWCDTTRRKSAMDFGVDFEHGTVHANNAELSVQVAPGAPVPESAQALLQAPVLPYPVGFYLRGEEFTLQLEIFLQHVLGQQMLRADIDPNIAATIQDGLAADRLINDIARLGGLT